MKLTIIALCVALLAVPVEADLRGQDICGVPYSEAVIVTLQLETGRWLAWKTTGRDLNRYDRESGSLGEWDVEYVCDVEIDFGQFPGLDVRTARLHRLRRELAPHDHFDARRIIRGEAAPEEETATLAVYCSGFYPLGHPFSRGQIFSELVEHQYAIADEDEARGALHHRLEAAYRDAIVEAGLPLESLSSVRNCFDNFDLRIAPEEMTDFYESALRDTHLWERMDILTLRLSD